MPLIDPLIRAARGPAALGIKLALLPLRAALAVVEAAGGLGDERAAAPVVPEPAPETDYHGRGRENGNGPEEDALDAERAAAVSPMPDVAPEAVPEAPPPPEVAEAAAPGATEAPAGPPESELVAEFAEAGAEDGAGSEVEIREPWDGYNRMRAADIARRLRGESAETVATVELYESANKRRRGVMDAAGRRLRDLGNPATRGSR